MTVRVVIESGEDGYFVVHCPSLKTCCSQGKTREEALTNIKEAILLYLEPMSLPLLSGRQILGALGRLGFVESHRKEAMSNSSIKTVGGLSSRFTMKLTAIPCVSLFETPRSTLMSF
jgi:predicted RNase H-like HicB family nuclease